MKNGVLQLVIAMFAIGVSVEAATSESTQPVPGADKQASIPQADAPKACVGKEEGAQLENMTEAEREAWAIAKGILPATAVSGQGCDYSGPCSSGTECYATSTCFGPIDSGEQWCPHQLSCTGIKTVHFYRCLCSGTICPLYEATGFFCAAP